MERKLRKGGEVRGGGVAGDWTVLKGACDAEKREATPTEARAFESK